MEELKEEREILIQEKIKINKYLKNLENYIKKKDCEIYDYCIKNCNGHDFVIERELCMYGETFRVCKICGYEY